MQTKSLFAAAGLLACASVTYSQNAVVITHEKALAGGVTKDDAPGYPVTISKPGSYRLGTNLLMPDGYTDAISILSDQVQLDLNGFAILGKVTCTGEKQSFTCLPIDASGIAVVSGNKQVVVRNGQINGFQVGAFLNAAKLEGLS